MADADRVDPLPSFGGPLRLDGAAGARAFVVAGRRAALVGDEDDGVRAIWLHPFQALHHLRLAEADPDRVAATGMGFERRLEVRGRLVVERCSVAPEAALAVLEWEVPTETGGSAPCFDPADLELSWTTDLAPAAGPLTLERDPLGATLRRGDASLAIAIEGAEPQLWAVEPAGDGGAPCRLAARVPPGGLLRLTITGSRGDAAPAEPRGAAASQVSARLGRLRRRSADRLDVMTSDAIVRAALGWAAYRLDGVLVDIPGAGRSVVAGYGADSPPRLAGHEAAWTAIAALAAGDFQLSADVLRHLAPLAHDEAAATALLLLASHHLAWSGDAATVHDVWPDVVRAAELCEAGDAPALARAALGEAATAAESLGLPLRPGAPAPTRSGDAGAPPAGAGARPEHAIAAAGGWADFAEGRATVAFDAWRAAAVRAVEEGRGMWSGPAGPDDAAATARVVSGFVYGLLGARPDAMRHRLRLRPQLPDAWETADVLRLRMGEAAVSLHYRREGERHRFEAIPEAGAVPVRLILEPALSAPVRAAFVDGEPARLDARPFGERVLAPVQLVLDHARTLELVTGPPGDVAPPAPGDVGPLVHLGRGRTSGA